MKHLSKSGRRGPVFNFWPAFFASFGESQRHHAEPHARHAGQSRATGGECGAGGHHVVNHQHVAPVQAVGVGRAERALHIVGPLAVAQPRLALCEHRAPHRPRLHGQPGGRRHAPRDVLALVVAALAQPPAGQRHGHHHVDAAEESGGVHLGGGQPSEVVARVGAAVILHLVDGAGGLGAPLEVEERRRPAYREPAPEEAGHLVVGRGEPCGGARQAQQAGRAEAVLRRGEPAAAHGAAARRHEVEQAAPQSVSSHRRRCRRARRCTASPAPPPGLRSPAFRHP